MMIKTTKMAPSNRVGLVVVVAIVVLAGLAAGQPPKTRRPATSPKQSAKSQEIALAESKLLDLSKQAELDVSQCEQVVELSAKLASLTPSVATLVAQCQDQIETHQAAVQNIDELADLLKVEKGQVEFVAKLSREYQDILVLLDEEPKYEDLFHDKLDAIEGGLEALGSLEQLWATDPTGADSVTSADIDTDDTDTDSDADHKAVDGQQLSASLKQYLSLAGSDLSEAELHQLTGLTDLLRDFLVARGVAKRDSAAPQVYLTVLPPLAPTS